MMDEEDRMILVLVTYHLSLTVTQIMAKAKKRKKKVGEIVHEDLLQLHRRRMGKKFVR